MERIKLSNSDLLVSPVCLGSWQFNGGKSDINWEGQDPRVSRDIVDKCFELGINFFDTAEAYGIGASEKLLGEALEGRRKDVILATKFGNCVTTNDGKYKAEDIEKAINKSLQSLRTDYIDLYQIHQPIFVADMKEAVVELKRQQALGKIRYYAISNFGPQNMKEFADAGGVAVSNQLPYNLLWRSIECEIVDVCDQHNVDILAYSPLQQGLLTGKFPDVESVPEGRRRTKHFQGHRAAKSRHQCSGAEELTFEAITAIRDICRNNGNLNMTTAAISWLLAKKRVASVITGASRPEQMELNCKTITLEKDLVSQLDVATEQLKERFGDDTDMWAVKGSRMR